MKRFYNLVTEIVKLVPSCTNEGQISSEKPQVHVYKTRNTPGPSCSKAD